MKYFKRIILFAAISVLIFAATACGKDDSINDMDYSALVYMEDTPIVDYSVPEINPNILVDTAGYEAAGIKKAALRGSKLGKEFRLIDNNTGKVVYQGNIDKTSFNEELDIYYGYASFDEVTAEGEYYLESENIGRSVTFQIKQGEYAEKFQEIYDGMKMDCQTGSADIDNVTALLITYEFYGNIYTDENNNNIPDVMEFLKSWTEKIDYAGIDASQGAKYATFLAKFSYLYQKFDINYATECLQKASALFTQNRNVTQNDSNTFFALTELYRATGLYTYKTQIYEYKAYFNSNSNYIEEPGYLYGSMTYMATRQPVNVDLSSFFMDSLMKHGEEIAERSDDMMHPVNAKNNGADEILARVRELACANYVLDSYQYNNIIQDYRHYLMGRNAESVCFYPDEGEQAAYLFLFAQLTSQQLNEQ